MFVKSIVFVVLLCASALASAQTPDLKESYSQAQEYLNNVKLESSMMTSFSHEEGLKAIQRGLNQFVYLDSELKYLKSKITKETESAYYRLENAARDVEEVLSQNIALAVGVGAVQMVIAELEKEGKIEKAEMVSVPEGRFISRGDFIGFPSGQSLYETGMGLSNTTRKIKLTYVNLVKEGKKFEIKAQMGSQVRKLAELKKLMTSGSGIFDWINGEFQFLSGLSKSQLQRFILHGNSVNFNSLLKANKGWISSPTFHTYQYGVIYIGDIGMVSVVTSQQEP